MVARAVEDADHRLHDLWREKLEDGALAAAAMALAIAASAFHPTLALPLFVGGLFVAGRARVDNATKQIGFEALRAIPTEVAAHC